MVKTQAPYGLYVIQSCLSCTVREDNIFCRLTPAALADLNAIRQSSLYPKGAVLFMEGQPPEGLFVVCSGKAKLTTSSPQGRLLIVRIANQGEVLGLSAVMSNAAYDITAETLGPTQVNFLPRPDFLHFLQKHGEVAFRVAEHLSMELHRAYQQVTRIALAPTARAKMAGLLLEWGREDLASDSKALRFQLHLSHEEIGELIGSSRETVNRLLNDFRRKGLIQTKGAMIIVPDPARLQALLA